MLAAGVTDSPASAGVDAVVVAGLRTVVADLAPRREAPVVREQVVAASAELRERELAKLASWSGKLRRALVGRGVADPEAHVVAGAAVAALDAAARRWLADPAVDLSAALDESLAALRLLATTP